MGVSEGKVALVTGGSRGVGAAIARSLAQEGAAVVVNYLRSVDKAEDVAGTIRGEGGKAMSYGAHSAKNSATPGCSRNWQNGHARRVRDPLVHQDVPNRLIESAAHSRTQVDGNPRYPYGP